MAMGAGRDDERPRCSEAVDDAVLRPSDVPRRAAARGGLGLRREVLLRPRALDRPRGGDWARRERTGATSPSGELVGSAWSSTLFFIGGGEAASERRDLRSAGAMAGVMMRPLATTVAAAAAAPTGCGC